MKPVAFNTGIFITQSTYNYMFGVFATDFVSRIKNNGNLIRLNFISIIQVSGAQMRANVNETLFFRT